jgi:hypothetical protein
MIRYWLGLALLGGSWLFGLKYFHEADYVMFAIMIIGGAVLLSGSLQRLPGTAESLIAAILLVPVVSLIPAPYKAIPLLLIVGLLLNLAPFPVRWPKALASGAFAAALVLLCQGLGLLLYESGTARFHDLPLSIAKLLQPLTSALDIDAAVVNTTLTLSSMRKTHPLGATWEMLMDPATYAFLVGGIAFVLLRSWSRENPFQRWQSLLPQIGLFALCVILWLPIRVGLHLSFYLHRVLRTDFDTPLNVMSQFWSNWFQVLLVVGAAVLGWRISSHGALDRALCAGVCTPDHFGVVATTNWSGCPGGAGGRFADGRNLLGFCRHTQRRPSSCRRISLQMGADRAADGHQLVRPPLRLQLCDHVRLLVALLRSGSPEKSHQRLYAEKLRCADLQSTHRRLFRRRSLGDHQVGGRRRRIAAGRRAHRCLWHRLASQSDCPQIRF